ncbi:DUF817 domain-containing protein [Xylanibacillus composti]|uniref:DUF817 domain-containing protein n=1 Tax=Xylanibacillus composti TaxID=1572762 RepID=A0A8J4H8Q8_9BACL|nr:DUF817 domain-containing protein [Xylanibacillus composti]MDT9725313.1 DUF817 domain-containing protein [Xylanibacillus composti]GIQ71184.1 hypothetical protein XYCOK13_40080 [Xylanibacillus composti]
MHRRLGHAVQQLARFGWQQALSCVFPVAIFASLALTQLIPLPWLPRYDWLLIICLAMQVWMLRSGLETRDELKVITVFHLIGLALELFKVRMGSWSYPEEGWTKVGGVPLYSGFMYASVASYLCQAWRRMKVHLVHWPSLWLVAPLAASIYLNFFTHHYWIDIRWWLSALVLLVFWRTWVTYEVGRQRYRMPLALSFVLIGFFIWIAENVATFFSAWEYPNQSDTWRLVHVSKISSWLLLVIVSFLIVAALKRVKEQRPAEGTISRSHRPPHEAADK